MKLSYKTQSVVLVVWIVVVMLLFKFIAERQLAAVIAGLGFVIFPSIFLIAELKTNRNWVHILALSIFLICSALPIFLLRILNWGVEFNTLSLLGVSADSLHKTSNSLYMLMLASTLYVGFKYRKIAKN